MKIKIMECSWDKDLENKTLEVQKITSKGPTVKQLLYQIIERLDKFEKRLDDIVRLNKLIDPTMKHNDEN